MATAVIFHHDFANVAERNVFFKDLALAGALMFIAITSGDETLSRGGMPNDNIFFGLKVVDLASFIAGPQRRTLGQSFVLVLADRW